MTRQDILYQLHMERSILRIYKEQKKLAAKDHSWSFVHKLEHQIEAQSFRIAALRRLLKGK